MADQGASQRRGTESTVSLVSQGNSLVPIENYGTSYYESGLGSLISNDTPSQEARLHEVGFTPIGVPTVATGNNGTYMNSPLGLKDAHDLPASATRLKETGYSFLGQTTPETSSYGTSYNTDSLGAATPFGTGGGGTSTTTYYKLRARDSSCGSPTYVEWVTTITPLTVGSFTGVLPCGGPLVELTVLSIVTH